VTLALLGVIGFFGLLTGLALWRVDQLIHGLANDIITLRLDLNSYTVNHDLNEHRGER
jgi:hypothetical protein